MQGPAKDELRVSMVPRWASPPGRSVPRRTRIPILESLILAKHILDFQAIFISGGHLISGWPLEASPVWRSLPSGRNIVTDQLFLGTADIVKCRAVRMLFGNRCVYQWNYWWYHINIWYFTSLWQLFPSNSVNQDQVTWPYFAEIRFKSKYIVKECNSPFSRKLIRYFISHDNQDQLYFTFT